MNVCNYFNNINNMLWLIIQIHWKNTEYVIFKDIKFVKPKKEISIEDISSHGHNYGLVNYRFPAKPKQVLVIYDGYNSLISYNYQSDMKYERWEKWKIKI